MSGSANGTCTDRRMRASVMPIPRADSTVAGSTWRTPVNVNVKMGGIASSTSAMTTGMFPSPNQITPSTSTANDGIARPTLATFAVSTPERRLRPSSSPPGTAMADAIAIAHAQIQR